MRPSGRAPDEMRAIEIVTNFTKHAEGSVLVCFGDTKVLVTASVEERVPPFLRGKGEGWVTAGIFDAAPRHPHPRQPRSRQGQAVGPHAGNSAPYRPFLRAVTDLKKLGERQITLDCDVIQADGGTRTASISGAWIALRLAINGLMAKGLITEDPLPRKVAAVSCGIVNGTPVLDLITLRILARTPTPISS
jgi:ribonuclease PH